jgi:hypothetical protein
MNFYRFKAVSLGGVPENYLVLVGRKGLSSLAGIAYYVTPPINENSFEPIVFPIVRSAFAVSLANECVFVARDFVPRKSIASRYARAVVNSDYYGVLSVIKEINKCEQNYKLKFYKFKPLVLFPEKDVKVR